MLEVGDVTIWLQIELDDNIYPDLHDTIDRASEPEKQAERLRHLASIGLVWEESRISEGARSSPAAFKFEKAPVVSRPADKARKPPADRFIPTLFDVVEPAGVAEEAAPEGEKTLLPTRGSSTPRNSSRLQKMRAKGFFALD